MITVALTACGQSSTSDASSSVGSSPAAASTASSSTGDKDAAKPVRVAVLMGATTNAYQAAALAAATDEATALGNVELTTYDAAFDPAKQVSQIEDVTSLGTSRFDAILLFPVDNNLPVDAVKAALAAGLEVGVADGVLGPLLTTKDIQIDGVSVQVGPVWSSYGERLARLTAEACEGIDPCNVIFTKGLTNWAPEVQYRESFGTEIAKSPNVHVVAEPGDTGYSREGGLKVIGDAIQANPSADVIIAADQALLGAETALDDAGLLGKVKLVGVGGTKQGVDRINAGIWFGTVGQAPADEGKLGLEGVVTAVRGGADVGGVDSQASIVNDAVITKEFAAQFTPQFEG